MTDMDTSFTIFIESFTHFFIRFIPFNPPPPPPSNNNVQNTYILIIIHVPKSQIFYHVRKSIVVFPIPH